MSDQTIERIERAIGARNNSQTVWAKQYWAEVVTHLKCERKRKAG